MGLILSLALGLLVAALVVGAAALVVACMALTDVKALKASTHSIEYINPQSLVDGPTDQELERTAKRAGLIPDPDGDLDGESLEDL